MKDELGDRMKGQYEDRTRFLLPRRTYTIIRLDGKAFHTYTKKLKKPFDKDLIADLDRAIINMLPELQGAVFAYTQSDEISVLLTDFSTTETSAWFDGNLQKIASVAASIITAQFNVARVDRIIGDYMGNYDYPDAGVVSDSLAYFDARVFTIPDRVEVMNYFIWRNQDCIRNAISMIAQHHFSHKQLQGVSTTGMKDMLTFVHPGWENNYTNGEKNGRLIVKESYTTKGLSVHAPSEDPKILTTIERTQWVSQDAWKFTDNKDKLLEMVPKYPE